MSGFTKQYYVDRLSEVKDELRREQERLRRERDDRARVLTDLEGTRRELREQSAALTRLHAQLADETAARARADADAATLRQQVAALHEALQTARQHVHDLEHGQRQDADRLTRYAVQGEAFRAVLLDEAASLALSSPVLERAVRTLLTQPEAAGAVAALVLGAQPTTSAAGTGTPLHPPVPPTAGPAAPTTSHD